MYKLYSVGTKNNVNVSMPQDFMGQYREKKFHTTFEEALSFKSYIEKGYSEKLIIYEVVFTPLPDDVLSEKISLEEACERFLGGLGAISPGSYKLKLEKIAKVTGRENDEIFRKDVANILSTFPSIFD